MNARAPANADPAIEIRGLHKRLGGRAIHRGLDLTVNRGELLSVIGASGAGKTILMHEIIGLAPPDAGTIRVLGQSINHLAPWEARRLRRRWGVLFQQAALFSAMTVYDNLAFPVRELWKEGMDVDEHLLREGIALKLHMVGLHPADAWKYPSELSGGMAKRAALARALMLEAELLFLDEPTSGLDPAAAAEFDTLLAELHDELHLTALLITHDVYSVAALSDRIAVLAEGHVIGVGTLEEIARLEHPFITDFLRARPGHERLHAVSTHAGR